MSIYIPHKKIPGPHLDNPSLKIPGPLLLSEIKNG
jgi:hypothetical protein